MNKLTPTALALLLLASTAMEAAAQEHRGRGGDRSAASDNGARRGGDGQRGPRADGARRDRTPQAQTQTQTQTQAPPPARATPPAARAPRPDRNQNGWNRGAAQPRATPPAANRGGQPGMWNRGRPTADGVREQQRRDQNASRPTNDRRDWDNNRRDNDRRWDGRRDNDRSNWDRPNWNDRRDNDRRWDSRDNRRWDNNDRNRQRPRYDRRHYPSVWRPSQRFRMSIYRPPVGYYHRAWNYGDILPRGWWGPNYYISDWWQYDLPIPPIGYEWVRVGEDAYLVDTYTGRVVQVAYDIFYW